MEIQIAKPFEFLFDPARYKGAHGGRGSGKSHAFAQALLLQGSRQPLRILCAREIQRSIKDSVKRLIDDLIQAYGLGGFYESTETEVRGKNGTLFLFAGLRTNIEAIKSMEGLDIAWVEEADRVSQRSLELLIPTIRKENSELWFSWNPNNELDPVDLMFRSGARPPNMICREVNYLDNDFCPQVLIDEANFDKEHHPDKYNHVWLGQYNLIKEGAYYAKQLSEAITAGRISKVEHNPNLPVHTAWDLGWSDYTTIWFYQYVGQEIHFIDYMENSHMNLADYALEMRKKPYTYAPLVLPHDAYSKNLGTGKSFAEILSSLQFSLRYGDMASVPKLSIQHGIEASRSVFNRCWFDSEKCKLGLTHLQSYRENFDEKLRISKGPLHDEHSHGADAFRYFAVSADSFAAKDNPFGLDDVSNEGGVSFERDSLGRVRIV